MTKCPECGSILKKERREISPGIYAEVEVCSKCEDEWIDEKEYERLHALFRRKIFKIGGSLAVRIPKEIVDAIGLHDGDDLSITKDKNKIIIEPTSSG